MQTNKTLLTGVVISSFVLPSAGINNAFANANQETIANEIIAVCSQTIPPQQPAIAASVQMAALSISDATTTCNNYATLNDSSDYEAQVTPDEVPAQHTSLVQISSSQIANIRLHLSGKRQQQHGEQNATAALAPELTDYLGGAAGSDLFNGGRLSVFLSGSVVDGDQDDTNYEVGYDLSTDHYTLGADLQINSEWLVGAAYGATQTELEYSQFSDQTDNDTDHVLLYSSWYRKNFAVDMTLGYASGEFTTLRHLPGSGSTPETARGSTDNKMAYASISGAYDFNQGSWSYGPLSGLDYLKGSIDAFEEQGDSSWNSAFESQDVKSMIFTMGAQTAYAQSFSWGVIVPHAKAVWRYELEDQRDLIVGRFVIDPASSFTITPDSPDTSWYEVSAGLSAVMPHGISAFVNYEQVVSYDNTDLSTLSAGARLEF